MNNVVSAGQPERLIGVVIESESSLLRREAQQAQARWFAQPSLPLQREYALALRRWARSTRNRRALEHAQKLLSES